jgi:hypothetical protein
MKIRTANLLAVTLIAALVDAPIAVSADQSTVSGDPCKQVSIESPPEFPWEIHFQIIVPAECPTAPTRFGDESADSVWIFTNLKDKPQQVEMASAEVNDLQLDNPTTEPIDLGNIGSLPSWDTVSLDYTLIGPPRGSSDHYR